MWMCACVRAGCVQLFFCISQIQILFHLSVYFFFVIAYSVCDKLNAKYSFLLSRVALINSKRAKKKRKGKKAKSRHVCVRAWEVGKSGGEEGIETNTYDKKDTKLQRCVHFKCYLKKKTPLQPPFLVMLMLVLLLKFHSHFIAPVCFVFVLNISKSLELVQRNEHSNE